MANFYNTDKYIIEVELDEYAGEEFNPRQWDNMGTFIAFHRNFKSPDKYEHSYFEDELESRDIEYTGNQNIDVKEYLTKMSKDHLIYSVYIHDHTSVSFSLSNANYPFNDVWDSCLFGFIFTSKEKIREEYSISRITKEIEAKVYEQFKSEVKTYEYYANGEIFSYVLYDKETLEELDACCGYYGYDLKENGILSSIGIDDESELEEMGEHKNFEVFAENNYELAPQLSVQERVRIRVDAEEMELSI